MTIRVFLVEDLPAMRSLLIDLFTSIGNFQVVGTASTEAEANLWFSEFPGMWDLAIVDLILAEGSGLGVVPRAKATRPDADVIVLSAFASPGIEKHLAKHGVEKVFDKADTPAFIAWLDAYAQEWPQRRPGPLARDRRCALTLLAGAARPPREAVPTGRVTAATGCWIASVEEVPASEGELEGRRGNTRGHVAPVGVALWRRMSCTGTGAAKAALSSTKSG